MESTLSSKKDSFFKDNRVHLCSRTFKIHPFFAMRTHWSVRVTPPGVYNVYQGRRQGKSLEGAKLPRGSRGPGGGAPWWGSGGEAP